MSDLISIIVPVYNVKTEYFKNSINSILAQSYDNWECLLIDDGSTNGCGKICDEFESFDSRIKAIHTDNKGVSAARNRGLSEAKGNFIVFIDSDDTISSDYLKILYQIIKDENSDCVIGGCKFVYGDNDSELQLEVDGTIQFKSVSNKEAMSDLFYMKHPYDSIEMTAVWGTLYSTEKMKNIKFNESMCVGEDFIFKYQFFENSTKISYADIMLYNYYIRNNSIMRQSFNQKKYETFCELEKYMENTKFSSENERKGFLSRVVNIAFVLYLSIPDKDSKYLSERNQIVEFIKKYRTEVITNKNTRLKVKVALGLSFINFKLINIVMNMLNH